MPQLHLDGVDGACGLLKNSANQTEKIARQDVNKWYLMLFAQTALSQFDSHSHHVIHMWMWLADYTAIAASAYQITCLPSSQRTSFLKVFNHTHRHTIRTHLWTRTKWIDSEHIIRNRYRNGSLIAFQMVLKMYYMGVFVKVYGVFAHIEKWRLLSDFFCIQMWFIVNIHLNFTGKSMIFMCDTLAKFALAVYAYSILYKYYTIQRNLYWTFT